MIVRTAGHKRRRMGHESSRVPDSVEGVLISYLVSLGLAQVPRITLPDL